MTSPILFLLFINDLINYHRKKCDGGIFLSDEIEKLLALLFADDVHVALFADSIIGLQRSINCTESFCNTVGMKINLDKTKIVVFRNGGTLKTNEVWLYKGEKIQVVSFYEYLGMLMTPKLVWSKTIEMLSKQALKTTPSILRYQSKFGHFHPKDMFKLFDSMVKPILCYGAEI